jgi:hypothetical protein
MAIRLFMKGGDIVAVHTLACAAREIYEKHCQLANIIRFYDHIATTYPEKTKKEIFDVLNSARNFFKHPDSQGNLDATIELSDKENKLMLFLATYDCSALLTDQTPLIVQAYNVWFMATEPGFRDGDCLRGMEESYHGIGSASTDEQRSIGCRFIDDTLSGKH